MSEQRKALTGLYFGEMVTGRYSPTALCGERRVVPDGDPCPLHGLPTRLALLPDCGYYSGCPACDDAFLDWYGTIETGARVSLRPAPEQRALDL